MPAHTIDEQHEYDDNQEHFEAGDPQRFEDDPMPSPRIERKDTGTRVALSILFGVIWSLVESGLFVIVVFGLIWSLVTQQAPPLRLRQFSNRLVSYSYEIWRYLTQNDPTAPFPFSDLPEAREEPADLGQDRAEHLHDASR